MTRTDALVSPGWLREHLDDPELRILHVTNEEAEYAAGHLPGALFAGGYADFTEDRDGVRALVPRRETMQATLARLGVTPEHRVVLYAGARSPWPARAYWVLRYFGFPRVHIADGALPALGAAGLPVETEPAQLQPVESVTLPEGDASILAVAEDVLDAAQGGGATILDCRTDEEWHGQHGGHAPQPRLGRIPRAVHIEWERLVDAEGRFLPPHRLRSMYAAAGVDGTRPAFPYCGGGVRSAVAWFVLHELLGYDLTRNYDGSWSEWAVRSDLPIETDL